MPRNDLNLDAYRIISDNLLRVRTALRVMLEETHGAEWEELVEPEDRRLFLTQRREREISINWRRTKHDDILDYGNFSDLYEFIAASPALQERFAVLAKDPDLLRLRFLELDTLFNRVAYARELSDGELELLISFDDRLKRLDAEPPAKSTPAPAPRADRPPRTPAPPRDVTSAKEAPAGGDISPAPQAASQPEQEGARERAGAKPAAAKRSAPEQEPVTSEPGAPPAKVPSPAPAPRQAASDRKTFPTVTMAQLREALEKGDEQTILAAIYSEVTALADGLWSDASPPAPRFWESLRESDWYSTHFAKLGLKAVSDFYDLAGTARERMLEGTSRRELQEFLKEHRFAQVLLALRDLFRQRLAIPTDA